MKNYQIILWIVIMVFVFDIKAYAQPDWNTAGNVITSTEILGANAGSTVPLRIGTIPALPIIFSTAGAPRATIRGQVGFNQGFFGINTANPLQQLHVIGDINLQTNIFIRNATNDGYRINNITVLAVKNSNDLFVGFGAGASWVSTGVHENTFVGNNSGFSNTIGARNAFFGFNSGRNNVTGTDNTFLGFRAGAANTSSNNTFVGTLSGLTNTTGQFNTFIGNLSGGSNTSGRFNTYLGCFTVQGGTPSTADNNTYIGYEAGQFTTTGDRNVLTGANAGHDITIGAQNVISGMDAGFSIIDGGNNVFIGWESAIQNTSGNRNVFSGSRTGRNQLGDYCTFIGYEAGYDNTTNTYTLTNAAGIGANAVPTADNKMILGDNNVWVGIGLTNDLTASFGPQNSLEINARALGTGAVIVDASGLRFRQLTSASPATPVTNKVLSVNSFGDVILVTTPPAGTGTVTGAHNGTSMSNITANFVAFGQDISEPGNPGRLQSDREVPMNTFDIQFNGLGTSGQNLMSLGMPNPFAGFTSKFFSFNDWERASGLFLTDGTNITTIYPLTGPIGTAGLVQNLNTDLATGVYGFVNAATSTFTSQIHGVYGRTVGIAGGTNMGVRGEANTIGATCYGGFFQASGGTTVNYGIYSTCVPSSGSTPPTGPNYAGYFVGDVVRTGTDNFTSDQMLKTNIDTLADALSIIMQLRPKSFEYKQSDFPSMNLPSGKQFGFVAQDVQPILPELVNTNIHPADRDSLGAIINPEITYLSLEYQQLIALLTRSIQQQHITIDSLSQTLSEVITTINSCCNSNHSMQQNNNSTNSIASHDVNLKDEQSIVLETNVPNPFAEQTTINYFLPDNVLKAQMLFYNVQGKLIQAVELTEKGKGSLNVFAQDLSNGIYTYTLVVDGKVFETKKMVKQK